MAADAAATLCIESLRRGCNRWDSMITLDCNSEHLFKGVVVKNYHAAYLAREMIVASQKHIQARTGS